MNSGAGIQHPESQRRAFIALGSNLGEARENVRNAMQRLATFSENSLLISSLWQSTPVDCPADSHLFVNAVIGLQPRQDETPESLLEKMQRLEKEFGRQPKKVLNEARPLDLDLIAFGDEVRSSGILTLPHPRAHERRFVLQPLAEIAPDLILSGQTKPVKELLNTLKTSETLVRLD